MQQPWSPIFQIPYIVKKGGQVGQLVVHTQGSIRMEPILKNHKLTNDSFY